MIVDEESDEIFKSGNDSSAKFDIFMESTGNLHSSRLTTVSVMHVSDKDSEQLENIDSAEVLGH
jgi:hypothetical protein